MENYENMYKNVCRLCLKRENSDKFVSLVENESANNLSCYGESVKIFAQISIEKDDNFPKNMCQRCLFLLKCSIYFKFKCESSEKILKNWSKNHVNKRCEDETNTSKNYQYKLFKEYFPDENDLDTLTSDVGTEVLRNRTESMQNFDQNDYSNEGVLDSLPAEDKPDLEMDSFEDSGDELFDMLKSNIKPIQKNMSQKRDIHKNAPKKCKTSTKRDKYECDICKKVLANQVTYSNHMEYHTGCRFICEHCGKGFPALARLQGHQLVIHGTGPYLPCQYCSYKAPRKTNLIEHERLHTGERPFTCDKCGLTFRRRAIWRKHMIHHLEKTVQCSQCPRKFFTTNDMMAHSNNIHERVYMYSCHKCDAIYTKTETVRKHLTERHGIPREMQGKIMRINRGKTKNIVEP